MELEDFLKNIGIHKGHNIIIHSSFSKIRASFKDLEPDQFILKIKDLITEEGSIIFPTFTYCYKKLDNSNEIYDKKLSMSKTGVLSEFFRKTKNVIRTNSPTHSFAIWGNITKSISSDNAPISPLGKSSVLEWLFLNPNSFILMLGTDFSSLSFIHFLESYYQLPYVKIFPWEYLKILPVGVWSNDSQNLIEVPGCSKGFINLERYLLNEKLIEHKFDSGIGYYYFSVNRFVSLSQGFIKNQYSSLLCTDSTCQACDTRRKNMKV